MRSKTEVSSPAGDVSPFGEGARQSKLNVIFANSKNAMASFCRGDMKALVITYGCRQNEDDGEKIKGVLESIGYELTDIKEEADVILFNTCSVRESAENRVYGNIGAIKSLKRKNKNLIIGLCGCMANQESVREYLREHYPYVKLIFSPNSIYKLPELLEEAKKERTLSLDIDYEIHEGLQNKRDSKVIANVPIMYGCNNFCSYCIVPYVRGRERSRKPDDIIQEIKELVSNGYKEVLLLGQNVNSYKSSITFPALLKRVATETGIKRIRFISSHPKDITHELIDVMAEYDNICPQLHLPFQSGSNKVLTDMNRKYTIEKYIETIEYARHKILNIAITSDVIVGFPTETQDDFNQTLELIKAQKFDMLFTFIYSPRKGTKSYDMKSVLTEDDKKKFFELLLKTQEGIADEINAKLFNAIQEILLEDISKTDESMLTGRTMYGKLCHVPKENLNIGDIVKVKIIKTGSYALIGEVIGK